MKIEGFAVLQACISCGDLQAALQTMWQMQPELLPEETQNDLISALSFADQWQQAVVPGRATS